MLVGVITRIEPQLGFGFIVDDAGMDWFFTAEDVPDDGMLRLRPHERVTFSYEWTPKGPRASDIRTEYPQHME